MTLDSANSDFALPGFESPQRRYAIVDVETTGLSPQHGNIIEIAMLISDGTRVINSYSTLVNPEKPLPPMIKQITGIHDHMLTTAPRFFEVARKLVELSQDAVFVAHNAQFDYSFLRAEYSRLGYDFLRPQMCTVRLARKFFPGLPSYKLSKLVESLKLPDVKPQHRALGDAEATAVLFHEIIKTAGPNFK